MEKEKDYESGFHYYGARYYWSELLTGWLSVDPMADKYPGISPYAYCMWNPVKLVDPDGMEADDYKLNTKTGSLILAKKTTDNFDMIIPTNGEDPLFVSKGLLNGEKIGDDISKTGFCATKGKQAEGISVMRYISFNSHRELSAWGYDDTKGRHCLDVASWDKNEPDRAWSSFNSGEYDKKGTRRFHVHTHPGTENGMGGFAKPSPIDAKRAENFMSDYYIISKKQGLSQYNSKGIHWEPTKAKTPDSLLPYRMHK